MRNCDGCTACCTVMQVDEIQKPAYTPCPSLARVATRQTKTRGLMVIQGCGIYETRPEPCKGYGCLWMAGGLLNNMQRPDKVGVIIDLTGEESLFTKETGIRPLTAREVRTNAFDEMGAGDLLKWLAKRAVVILIRGQNRKMIGPRDMMEKANAWAKRHPSLQMIKEESHAP